METIPFVPGELGGISRRDIFQLCPYLSLVESESDLVSQQQQDQPGVGFFHIRFTNSCIIPGSIPGGSSVAEKVSSIIVGLGLGSRIVLDRFDAPGGMALFSSWRLRSGSIQERIDRALRRTFQRAFDAWLTAPLRSSSEICWSEVLSMNLRPAVSRSRCCLSKKNSCHSTFGIGRTIPNVH